MLFKPEFAQPPSLCLALCSRSTSAPGVIRGSSKKLQKTPGKVYCRGCFFVFCFFKILRPGWLQPQPQQVHVSVSSCRVAPPWSRRVAELQHVLQGSASVWSLLLFWVFFFSFCVPFVLIVPPSCPPPSLLEGGANGIDDTAAHFAEVRAALRKWAQVFALHRLSRLWRAKVKAAHVF